ncbi:MAG: glycosyltransferase [Candidatus Hydrogenedentes bacterium]|nr:glycosyltransferase [Candidatus Hydrogenedentota bacterium]
MKILHVYKDFQPPVRGGMEHHLAMMCRFQRQWAEVEALTCSRSLRTRVVDRDGTRVTEVGEWWRFQRAPLAPTFPLHLRRLRADIVVVHLPNPTAAIAYLLARPAGKLVVRYQSDIVRQAAALRFYAPVQMRFLRKAHLILATCPQYLDSSPVLQRVRDRCRLLPLGILPDEFDRPDPERIRALRAQYGGPYVLFSGRHRYYKGLEFLVRAAGRIQAPVVIAGDGPERARCITLARELNVDIAFPGSLTHEELVNHLHGCEVFVFPSMERSEAFGISMLEAHACRKPVVATRLGTGVEFVNTHGQTGLNVPPRDPAALAQAVNELLDAPDRRRAMGEAARARVEAEFHAEHIARKEFEMYEELAR